MGPLSDRVSNHASLSLGDFSGIKDLFEELICILLGLFLKIFVTLPFQHSKIQTFFRFSRFKCLVVLPNAKNAKISKVHYGFKRK